LKFYQPQTNTEFYTVDIGKHSQDLIKIKMWCYSAPVEFARILILNKTGLHCYCFEDGDLSIHSLTDIPIGTVQFILNMYSSVVVRFWTFKIDGFNFVNEKFCYAWNVDNIFRLSIDSEIEVHAEMINMITTDIENIFATTNFMLIQTVKGIFSGCQSTGVTIAKVSSERFKKIQLINENGAFFILGALRDAVKILALTKKGLK